MATTLIIWYDQSQAHRIVKLEEDEDPAGLRLPGHLLHDDDDDDDDDGHLLHLVLLHEDGELWLLLEGGWDCRHKVVRSLPEAFRIVWYRPGGKKVFSKFKFALINITINMEYVIINIVTIKCVYCDKS